MGLGSIHLLRRQARPTPRLRAALALLVALATWLAPAPALAQAVGTRDSGAANAQAAILDNGSVANVADMNFGRIAQGNVAGTVTIVPSTTPGCAVTAGLIRSGVCQAARFAIRGRRNNRVRIREINGGQVTLNGPGGATMSVNNLTIGVAGLTSVNGANGWNFGNWRIDAANGITEFWLGGTLNVKPAQRAGIYTGTVIIQIQFN